MSTCILNRVKITVLRRDGVLRLADVAEGMVLWGTVRNVVDFGIFVDVGLETDGLIHHRAGGSGEGQSRALCVGSVCKCVVVSLDKARSRLGLRVCIKADTISTAADFPQSGRGSERPAENIGARKRKRAVPDAVGSNSSSNKHHADHGSTRMYGRNDKRSCISKSRGRNARNHSRHETWKD
eukprot:SAG31_NODE_11593_length_1015_cov_1.028384_2_plen_182_part_00